MFQATIFSVSEAYKRTLFRRTLTCLPLAAALVTPLAHAYRPFEGTDAAVAEPGLFELELGARRTRSGASRSLALPAVVGNFGIEGDSEIVIEGRLKRQFDEVGGGYASSLDDTAISFKHLFHHGSLQGGTGLSIAAECGILLPALHGETGTGTGAVCAGIASQRWAGGALHVNAALTRTREHAINHTLSVIVEGSDTMALRPVMEILAKNDSTSAHTQSVLLGAIWKKSEELSFDVGVRRAKSEAAMSSEVRVGLTWSLPWRS